MTKTKSITLRKTLATFDSARCSALSLVASWPAFEPSTNNNACHQMHQMHQMHNIIIIYEYKFSEHTCA